MKTENPVENPVAVKKKVGVSDVFVVPRWPLIFF